MSPEQIEFIFVIFCGLVFGSFVTLASYRLPLGEDIYLKPSRCPKCERKLGFRDLWPVLSWLLSQAKCRHCQTKISARYPLTELTTAALFTLVYLQMGLTPVGVVLALFVVALMVMVVVDFEHYIIPDEVHYVLLPLGVIYHYLVKTPISDVIGGLLLGLGLGLALHYGYKIIRKKDGLGFGDVKFLAVAGLWLGVMPMVPFLFLSGVFGIATGLIWRGLRKGALFPFGPALAASLFVCVLYSKDINILNNIVNIINNTN